MVPAAMLLISLRIALKEILVSLLSIREMFSSDSQTVLFRVLPNLLINIVQESVRNNTFHSNDKETKIIKTCGNSQTNPFSYCDSLSTHHSKLGICKLI